MWSCGQPPKQHQPQKPRNRSSFPCWPRLLKEARKILLIERAMLRGLWLHRKKDRIYEFARTHPTGSAFASFLKEMYGYEGFPDEAAGLDYVYSGTDSIELHWTDEHGKKRETKLSWPQAAGIVQRLVDEGRRIWRHPPSVSRCSRMKRSLSAANTAC